MSGWVLVRSDDVNALTDDEIVGVCVRLAGELRSGKGTPSSVGAWRKLQATVRQIDPDLVPPEEEWQ